ncbi:MAG: DEAD/DEAH box helicase [Maribacter dokdonensis]|uniref:Superfamily II DNA or RNA helicase n=1 Tax=Maribacter dokdonensis TaxID=320912 RepID=A0A1H4S1F6_9FLAO|nr:MULTISPECIES: DEAD/DEAH box helicase [Maribacter]HAF79337.1 ATP-dependent helicase [Maribacter sp.]KSA13641.1 ATP-dependent helicase [Maribacter dokdonensis DSW-8]CAG2532477.1 ATP-dependent helicase IRC3 [Maribacter dokdonensis]SDS48196.1 Superfamily II DNA or RNA helicase [Maribacter dokdonensis]SEC37949.1 Superfamily II DNA or RNA helicase [Maribacter dokdonensis]
MKLHKETAEKTLYDYQEEDLHTIFKYLEENGDNSNLLYQLPTGGGKTVVFSEIAKRYIAKTNKKVIVLTHRIELSQQTSRMLKGFGVKNKIINSEVKEWQDQDEFMCFVAMVETLNNRLQEEKVEINNIGLVIIDEAHYNSFRKLFKYFENSVILGVTATPLSSNIKLPMKDNYKKLIVGESIESLIQKKFLAKANMYNYDVSLQTLKLGISGDYTVKSSDELYGNHSMLNKLVSAYNEIAKGTKTLIFNNGINTSRYVCETFKKAGYNIRHLDNKNNAAERKEILKWFKETPDAILTSVSILTTGFDEPSVETIILNRATRSLTLYFQMIGRGSRYLPNKQEFNVIDMGNNVARFGLWNAGIDWQEIFHFPDFYLENIKNDEEIEREFVYEMPPDLRAEFAKSTDIDFDIKAEYKKSFANGEKSKLVLEKSIEQHAKICVENSEDVFDARILAKKLKEEIQYRVRQYSYCIMNNTKNYKEWLEEDYERKLRSKISKLFAAKM